MQLKAFEKSSFTIVIIIIIRGVGGRPSAPEPLGPQGPETSVISILKRISISIIIPFFPNIFISISNFHFTENSYFNSNSIL